MNIQLLTCGDLEITCQTRAERKAIKSWRGLGTSLHESRFIKEFLEPLGYKEIFPEDCGALTSAPLITDGKNVWGYMNYQVESFLESLVAGKTIIWQKG